MPRSMFHKFEHVRGDPCMVWEVGARAGEHPYLVGGGPGSGPEGVPVCGKEGGRHMYGDPPPQQTDRHN